MRTWFHIVHIRNILLDYEVCQKPVRMFTFPRREHNLKSKQRLIGAA